MKIEFACCIEQNNKMKNDDRAMVGNDIIPIGNVEGFVFSPCILAVCDGCGGYKGGWYAAERTLQVLSDYPFSNDSGKFDFELALNQCEETVDAEQKEYPSFSEMCTTIAGCFLKDEGLIIFHSGDSRIYRFDGRFLSQMTVDHSKLQEVIDYGMLTEDEAISSIPRNIVTRCIGMHGLPPEIYELDSHENGDMFLLCSDGLCGSLSAAYIKSILSTDISLSEMCRLLVNKAIEAGSTDNITCLICKIDKSYKNKYNNNIKRGLNQ